jgi:uncharacterized protein YidB (DUF937 family)
MPRRYDPFSFNPQEAAMGILDDLLAGAMGGGRGMGQGAPAPAPSRGGMGGTGAMGNMGGIMAALLPVVLAMLANRGGGATQAGMPGMGGGGLGDILGQVLGGGAQSGMGGSGGLGALLEGLQRAGQGDVAKSWVGTGQNLPISPDAIGEIFGSGGLSAIARQAGISESEATAGLSELLPEVVDRVTPDGQVPDLDSLTASVQDLGRRFGLA